MFTRGITIRGSFAFTGLTKKGVCECPKPGNQVPQGTGSRHHFVKLGFAIEIGGHTRQQEGDTERLFDFSFCDPYILCTGQLGADCMLVPQYFKKNMPESNFEQLHQGTDLKLPGSPNTG